MKTLNTLMPFPSDHGRLGEPSLASVGKVGTPLRGVRGAKYSGGRVTLDRLRTRCGACTKKTQRQSQGSEVGVDRRDVAERGVVGK